MARSRLSRTTGILANMLSTASHDLKAPLAAIQSLHQVILGGYAGEISEQQKKLLDRAGERIKGLVSQIDDIFDMPRIESCYMQREAVSIVEIANNSLENARPLAAGKKIELVADWEMEPPAVPAEQTRLQQALNNLLGNAIKFTQSGGKVTLRITDDDEGQEIVMEVMDNGPGIAGEELPRIFDDFYRGKDAPIGGAGVGLSNAKRIIEAHGGRIWAESPYPEPKKAPGLPLLCPRGKLSPTLGRKRRCPAMKAGTNLEKVLESRRFAVTAEVGPPKGAGTSGSVEEGRKTQGFHRRHKCNRQSNRHSQDVQSRRMHAA